jgi:hypothetical protein
MRQTNQGFAASRKTAFQFKGQSNGNIKFGASDPTTTTISQFPTCTKTGFDRK